MTALPTAPVASLRDSYATSLGHAVEVLVASRARSVFRLGGVHAFLDPPLRLRQIRFAYNGAGVATGYVAWAYLTDAVLAEIRAGSRRLLDLAEWNEGARLVVMDLVCRPGGATELLRALAAVAGEDRQIWWRRSDRNAPLRSTVLRACRVAC